MGDVGQLKGSISSNIVIPICSAFSPETQLWGLCRTTMPWAGQCLSMLLSCFQMISRLECQCAHPYNVWIAFFTLAPLFFHTLCISCSCYFQLGLLLLWVVHSPRLQCKNQRRSCLWLNCGTGSAGYTHLTLLETCKAQRKEVIHLVSSWTVYSVCLFIDKKKTDFAITFSNGSTNSAY